MEDIGDIRRLKSINVDEDRIFHKIVDVKKRKDYLAKVGIAVSEEELLLMYGYPDDSE